VLQNRCFCALDSELWDGDGVTVIKPQTGYWKNGNAQIEKIETLNGMLMIAGQAENRDGDHRFDRQKLGDAATSAIARPPHVVS
jgi:hypothetical protein